VGVHDSFCSLDQIEDAIFGEEQVNIATGALSRRGDGFYGLTTDSSGRREGKDRRVSCVYVVEDWNPGFETARVLRFENPFCLLDFPRDVFPPTFIGK
jgi:hypothetical protein